MIASQKLIRNPPTTFNPIPREGGYQSPKPFQTEHFKPKSCFRLIFIPEEELIEEEEELATPEFGDINTEFGTKAVQNPVDANKDDDGADVEGKADDVDDDALHGDNSFRLSDIQEQIEE